MDNNQTNLRSKPGRETSGNGTSVEKVDSPPHFKRDLVPLDEYAARQGISSDIIEQQGLLGALQIRKFNGRKFVVDVSPEQLSEFENGDAAENINKPLVHHTTTNSKIFNIILASVAMVIIVGLFWLYMDTKTKLDDLATEYKIVENNYNELASTKAEFARIQNRIIASRTDMEKIQDELDKTKQNLDTIQMELTTTNGEILPSRTKIERIQNGLNEIKNQLDTLCRQNAETGVK